MLQSKRGGKILRQGLGHSLATVSHANVIVINKIIDKNKCCVIDTTSTHTTVNANTMSFANI